MKTLKNLLNTLKENYLIGYRKDSIDIVAGHKHLIIFVSEDVGVYNPKIENVTIRNKQNQNKLISDLSLMIQDVHSEDGKFAVDRMTTNINDFDEVLNIIKEYASN